MRLAQKFHAFVGSAENYAMLADNVILANRLNRYFAVSHGFQDLSQRFGCPARRIFFHFVMRFDNLRSEIRAEQFGSFLRQPKEHVDSHAEIRC